MRDLNIVIERVIALSLLAQAGEVCVMDFREGCKREAFDCEKFAENVSEVLSLDSPAFAAEVLWPQGISVAAHTRTPNGRGPFQFCLLESAVVLYPD